MNLTEASAAFETIVATKPIKLYTQWKSLTK